MSTTKQSSNGDRSSFVIRADIDAHQFFFFSSSSTPLVVDTSSSTQQLQVPDPELSSSSSFPLNQSEDTELYNLFQYYCSKESGDSNVYSMSWLQLFRFLRQTRILNYISLGAAYNVCIAPTGEIGSIDYNSFKCILIACMQVMHHERNDVEATSVLFEKHIHPFAKASSTWIKDVVLDVVLSPPVVRLAKRYSQLLDQCFSFYSSSDMMYLDSFSKFCMDIYMDDIGISTLSLTRIFTIVSSRNEWNALWGVCDFFEALARCGLIAFDHYSMAAEMKVDMLLKRCLSSKVIRDTLGSIVHL